MIASLVCGGLTDDASQDPSSVPAAYRLNPRFKRQQGTLQQQVDSLQNQQQNGQGFRPQSSNNGQTSIGNSQSQNTNNNQGSTTTDAETQRVNNCIQQSCRQGVQLASLCGTDNVSYKNRPYFNCVRDCGRRKCDFLTLFCWKNVSFVICRYSSGVLIFDCCL